MEFNTSEDSNTGKHKNKSIKDIIKKTVKRFLNWLKNFNPTKLQKRLSKTIYLVILGVLVIAASLQTGYILGINKKIEKNKQSDKTALNKALNNSPSPYRSITGIVESITSEKIEIKRTNGESVSIKLNDKTKISRKKDTLTTSDIKKDQRVTVFTNNDQKDLVANRIVISSQN